MEDVYRITCIFSVIELLLLSRVHKQNIYYFITLILILIYLIQKHPIPETDEHLNMSLNYIIFISNKMIVILQEQNDNKSRIYVYRVYSHKIFSV